MAARCSPRIVTNNLIKSATLAASPALNASYPVDNLKYDLRSLYAKTSSTAAQEITFTHDTDQVGDMAWIPVDTDWTVSIEFYNAAGTSVFSKSLVAGMRLCLADFCVGVNCWGDYAFYDDDYRPDYFDPVTYRSGKITLTRTGAAVATIPTIVVGKSWQPEYGADVGMSVTPVYDLAHKRTEGGSGIMLGTGKSWREMTMDLSSLSAAERVDLYNRLACQGVLIDALPNDLTDLRMQHCFIANWTPPAFVHGGAWHSINPTFIEV